jgi:hypothetical protein
MLRGRCKVSGAARARARNNYEAWKKRGFFSVSLTWAILRDQSFSSVPLSRPQLTLSPIEPPYGHEGTSRSRDSNIVAAGRTQSHKHDEPLAV